MFAALSHVGSAPLYFFYAVMRMFAPPHERPGIHPRNH